LDRAGVPASIFPGETPRTRFRLEKAPAFGYRFGSPISKSLF
jgi:hypothetical protein